MKFRSPDCLFLDKGVHKVEMTDGAYWVMNILAIPASKLAYKTVTIISHLHYDYLLLW
jgi:hypothetical protein